MKQTEQYLRAATRGVWGRARRELQTELQGHIEERVAEFRLGGLGVEEAEQRTLRELGTPVRVSGGMLGVHTVPALGKAGALSVLLATALLTALPQGLAQVKSIYGNITNVGPSSYLNFQQLMDAIRTAGGEISGPPNAVTISVPGTPRSPYPLDTGQWPGATLTREGDTYLQTDILISGLRNTGADLRVSGWINPTLSAGNSNIHLETDDWRVLNDIYVQTLQASGPKLNAGAILNSLESNGNTSEITFKGNFKKDAVYAFVTPAFSDWTTQTAAGESLDRGNIILKSNVNQAKAGQVQFRMDNDAQHFKLYSDVNLFQAALDSYRDTTKLHHWDTAHPAPALILELSGHFGPDAYRVVPSKEVQLAGQ